MDEVDPDPTFEALFAALGRAPALPVEPAATLAPGRRVGRYEIVAPLGRGAMGTVYRARDRVLGREVALKVLSSGPGRATVDRFRREVLALAAVRDEHVVAVHDAGADGGLPYLVLELVDGETLRARLDRGPLSGPDAHRLALELATGLAAAHAVGVIHRDLKPENVLVDGRGHARIVDFGLASLAEHDGGGDLGLTETGAVLGSAHYMAPEQVRGERVDRRADFFALGAVLYEAVSGRRAFAAPSRGEVMSAVLRDPPPAVPLPADLASRRVLALALRCLDKDAARRPAALAEVRDALDRDPEPAPAPIAAPATRYATSSGVHIAYQVVGTPGRVTVLAAPPFISNIEAIWESPPDRAWIEALAGRYHYIHYDRRGVGVSDPVDPDTTLGDRVEDLRAVLDAERIERVILLGVSEGGPSAIAFAARYPERVIGLIVVDTFVRLTTGDGYPHGITQADAAALIERWVAGWGTPRSLSPRLFVASRARDAAFVQWANRYERQCASPGAVRRLLTLQFATDVRPLVPRVRCPALVIHRRGDPCIDVAHGRYLAAAMPGARYVELDGIDHVPWYGDGQPLALVQAFIDELSAGPPAAARSGPAG